MQYLYARSKINSWIGNICHCICNNPHATANKKTVALSFSFSQCCHHTSPSILSSYSLIMAPSTLPTPASLKERDDSPSLQSSATVKKSLEDSQQLQLRELYLHDLQSWFVFYNIISQHLVNNLNTAKRDNKKLTKQVSQLQAKVQLLQSSITQSTTIDEIHSYEKHCLDLITPATAHCIMKDLGFPTVKEIPNSGNIASLLRSPFAQQWFTMFQGQESTITGVSIQKFANDMSNKLFWTKSLAVPTVAQVQVERNSFAKFIHDILAMQFFPVLQFKQLANKDSSKSDLLKLAFEQALDGDYDVSGKGPHSPYVSFVRRAVSLYSAAHFGHDDHDSWITKFLPIIACISQYWAGASSPLSCNKDVTIFPSNVRNAVANFVGKTVRMVLPQVAYEALTCLIILKTICTFFKGHSDLFIDLLKKCNSPNPNLNSRGAMDEQQFLHEHYIADVSVLGGYSTQDIEYFIDLHNKIKDECRLDKICDGPKVGGDRKFQLAFVTPVSGAASPIARSTCCRVNLPWPWGR